MKSYTVSWYRGQMERSLASARGIVPLLMNMLNPASVVDVGCGLGQWLSVFQERGVGRILGLDGSWVNTNHLMIPADRFMAVNLCEPIPAPGQFDLALSVEVAEHLPPDAAVGFVDFLTTLAPVVAFAAAIPGQGGNNHINEQWPDYWAALFEHRGFCPVDCIRPAVWDREDIASRYIQNLIVYTSEQGCALHPGLLEAKHRTNRKQLAVVHPRMFISAQKRLSLRQVLHRLPGAMLRAIVRRVLRR